MLKAIACFVVVLCCVFATSESYAGRKTYSRYSVYRVKPRTEEQLNCLLSLKQDKTDEDGITFWKEPNVVNETADIMVSPEMVDYLEEQLSFSNIPTKLIIEDVEEVINLTSRPSPIYKDFQRLNSSSNRLEILDSSIFFTSYQRYETIERKLQQLAQDPRVTVEVTGRSFEKRNLYLVKISSDPKANKPVIFIDAGHHAREWISHATGIYLMESIINDNIPKVSPRSCDDDECRARFDRNSKLSLEYYDYWFVPVVNPDGYEYSHTIDRLWRKTRSRNQAWCSGVDPNRNYPYHWREAGASSYPCHETYAGPSALSEPETRNVARILDHNKDRIISYLSLHSYSQLVLAPYGYGRVYPDNYQELSRVANVYMRSTSMLRGTQYKFGPSAVVLYPAAGGSDDYAHGSAKIPYSFTIELPDTGRSGFLLPPNEIIPVGQETAIGLRAMIESFASD